MICASIIVSVPIETICIFQLEFVISEPADMASINDRSLRLKKDVKS
jgi:hypothetical protein